MGYILLSRNTYVPGSLHVDYTVIQMRCHQLNLSVPNKAGHVFEFTLQVPDALQKSEEARTWVKALEETGAE